MGISATLQTLIGMVEFGLNIAEVNNHHLAPLPNKKKSLSVELTRMEKKTFVGLPSPGYLSTEATPSTVS